MLCSGRLESTSGHRVNCIRPLVEIIPIDEQCTITKDNDSIQSEMCSTSRFLSPTCGLELLVVMWWIGGGCSGRGDRALRLAAVARHRCVRQNQTFFHRGNGSKLGVVLWEELARIRCATSYRRD